MHRRRDIYGDDAAQFRPERWLDDSLKDIGWAYLPFNGGPRICLGRKDLLREFLGIMHCLTMLTRVTEEFALLEVTYTVARVVQTFPRIGLPPGEDAVPPGLEKQTLTLVVASAGGCLVSLQS